ncbi:MAG: hypothetical protein RL169_34 [Armatimonadota bacterium]|jgi:predicted DCC family thiol-disulfide oxidoreductase YuxK
MLVCVAINPLLLLRKLMLALIPKPVRDYGYRIVARNRYKWFGHKETCLMPTPALKARFIT